MGQQSLYLPGEKSAVKIVKQRLKMGALIGFSVVYDVQLYSLTDVICAHFCYFVFATGSATVGEAGRHPAEDEGNASANDVFVADPRRPRSPRVTPPASGLCLPAHRRR